MTTVKVVESIKAEAKAVWDILGDFGGIKVGGPITAFEIEGEGVGAVRTITMGGANVVERLEAFDPESFSLPTRSSMKTAHFQYQHIGLTCRSPLMMKAAQ